MPKYKQTSKIAKIGVNYVRDVVERSDCIFHKIEQENDLGIDAIIEFIRDEQPVNKQIAVQIKSGQSYFNATNQQCLVPVKDHYSYWKDYPLPVYGIVYDPGSNIGYWVNIQKYFAVHGECKVIKYEAHKANMFDLQHFKSVFMSLILQEIPNIDFAKALTLFQSQQPDEFYLGMLVLFRKYPNEERIWIEFTNYIRQAEAQHIPYSLLHYVSHIPWHPDIFSYGEPITEETTYFAQNLINQFDGSTIRKLLSLLGEDTPIQRGSPGQSIETIISSIPGVDDLLVEIIVNIENPLTLRENAALIYAYHKGVKSIEVLKTISAEESWYIPELINFLQEYKELNPYA